MDFDSHSLKISSGSNSNAVKNDYSAVVQQAQQPKRAQAPKKVEKNEQKASDLKPKKGANSLSSILKNESAENTKAAEEAAAESGKYNQDELYKGENFRNKMEQAIAEANKVMKPTNKSFAYSVHEETNEIIIQIKDNDTGEILKEIPSEESLNRLAKMRELSGIMIDEKR